MFAYRRKNVADLNARGRLRWEAAGRLSGPELVANGGNRYRAGDRIVTLASGAGGTVVTSERGTVVAVDPLAGNVPARMEDGRTQDFGINDTAADRLAHGSAVSNENRAPLPGRHRRHQPRPRTCWPGRSTWPHA